MYTSNLDQILTSWLFHVRMLSSLFCQHIFANEALCQDSMYINCGKAYIANYVNKIYYTENGVYENCCLVIVWHTLSDEIDVQ